MIDVTSEDVLAINDVPATLPNRPHVATIWRWVKRGSRGVKVETVCMGGRRYTSKAALSLCSKIPLEPPPSCRVPPNVDMVEFAARFISSG